MDGAKRKEEIEASQGIQRLEVFGAIVHSDMYI
jgi:hypothetical protein